MAKKNTKKNQEKKAAKEKLVDALESDLQEEDLSIEDPDDVTIADLEEQVQSLNSENDRLRDQLLRARAEFDNFKRRRSQEIGQLSALANESLIEDILPVLDDLELLLKNNQKENSSDYTVLMDGAKLIYKKLFGNLERRGLKVIETEGKMFDPELHEALLKMPAPGKEEDTILEVQQAGYKLGEKLLRPARVIVASEPVEEN
jgi:molecular chaperone GrpE